MKNDLDALRQPPEAGTEAVAQLVGMARQGRLRVPEFQRGLKWQSSDVVKLFDSIYRGLPVGSLLFWRRDAQASPIAFGPMKIDAPSVASAWWVVDGQQRLTALTAALARDLPLPDRPVDPYVVFFDALAARFVTAPKTGDIPKEFVPLPVLLDGSQLSEWVHGWALVRDESARRRVFEAGTRIRDYKVPRYLVDAADDREGRTLLREIFYRVNKTGKPLDWEDVHDALYGDEAEAPTKIGQLGDQLAKLGMGRPEGGTLTTCLLALRGLDVTRPLSEHRDRDPEILQGAVAEALPALRSALLFLRGRAGIPHLDLLPRTLVLDVLTRFFALHPQPSARNTALLVRWIWRVLAGEHALDERTLERRAIAAVDSDENDTLQKMLSLVSRAAPKVALPDAFDARAAESRLAALALLSLGPRDLIDGEPTDIATMIESRGSNAFARIVAKGTDEGRRGIENRVFTRASAPRRAILRRIEDYGEADEVLQSHAIGPKAAAALRAGNVERFLRTRRRAITSASQELAIRLAGTDRADGDRPTIAHLIREG